MVEHARQIAASLPRLKTETGCRLPTGGAVLSWAVTIGLPYLDPKHPNRPALIRQGMRRSYDPEPGLARANGAGDVVLGDSEFDLGYAAGYAACLRGRQGQGQGQGDA